MPVHIYRIQKWQFVDSLTTGEGARLYGGRWNPVGTPLVYTSGTPELALLEVLVHLEGTPLHDLPPYVLVTLALPDGLVETIAEADLPAGWNEQPVPDHVSRFLLPRLRPDDPALAFAVPSVILPESPTRNVLLNANHSHIAKVEIVSAVAFDFDGRLRPQPAAPATPPKRGRPRRT